MTDFTLASSAETPTGHSILCAAQPAWQLPEHRMHYWEWGPQSGRPAQHILFAVHGLTRQGLDFAALAEYLTAQHDILVIAPDVAGRGNSDWLPNPAHYQVGVYALDVWQLMQEVQASFTQPLPLTFLGTSMGGLIALALSATQPAFCDRLILNDVGPSIEWQALQRIGEYVGADPCFDSLSAALAYAQTVSASFGQLTAEQWCKLSTPQLRRSAPGQAHDPSCPWRLHYDPAIAQAFQALTPELAAQAESLSWKLYEQLRMSTLVLRGADSDLLSAATAQRMAETGPHAHIATIPNCGHAPALQEHSHWHIIETFINTALP